MKYICIAKCPELDRNHEKHCTTCSIESVYEDGGDGCPCGNIPNYVEMKEDKNNE